LRKTLTIVCLESILGIISLIVGDAFFVV